MKYDEHDLSIEGRLSAIETTQRAMLAAMDRLATTCASRNGSCGSDPTQTFLSGRVWAAIAGFTSFVAAAIVALIAVLPALFSVIGKGINTIVSFVQIKP